MAQTAQAQDARRLGAQEFVVTTREDEMNRHAGTLDFIIDTVSAPHDLNTYLKLLKSDGVMVLLGVPPESPKVEIFELIGHRRSLAGSMIGGITETQEMLDYCAENKIVSDVEVIPMSKVNEAYERMLKGDVRYRFVIDMKTL